jgi:hypothetical protein
MPDLSDYEKLSIEKAALGGFVVYGRPTMGI